MSFAQAQTAFQQAAAAIASQNYTLAIDQLLSAQAFLAAVPDSGRNGDTMTFGRELADLLASTRERERTHSMRQTGGLQRTRMHYRPLNQDGFC